VGRDFVEAHGGTVVLIPLVPGQSTTRLVPFLERGDGHGASGDPARWAEVDAALPVG
jgi:hypothetical protein